MKVNVGKVLGKSTPQEFNFVSSDYLDGKYIEVEVEMKSGQKAKIIGQIVSIEAVNPYFENPSLINYVGSKDESMASHTLYMVKAKIISTLVDDKKGKYNLPPSPGLNVFLADDKDIKIALGLKEIGIKIGSLRHDDKIEVLVSPTDLFKTHISVLGRTGSGKSYFLKNFIKEINKDRLIIIFSPTTEYNENSKNIKAQVISKQNLSIPIDTKNLSEIYDLTFQEQNILENFLRYWREQAGQEIHSISNATIANELKTWMKLWIRHEKEKIGKQRKLDFGKKEKFLTDIEEAERIPKHFETLIHKLASTQLYFSDKSFQTSISSVIFDMSELSQSSQEIYVDYVLDKIIYSYRKDMDNKKLPPLLIIVEEAHNFAPSVQSAYCKAKLIQIAREGRKLRLSLCIVSQRPRHIDQTILAQCGNLFLFHLPHPDDVNHVFNFSPVYSTELMNEIKQLSTGEYVILGDIIDHPVVCAKNLDQ